MTNDDLLTQSRTQSSTRSVEKPARWSDEKPFSSPLFWLALLLFLKLSAPFVPVPNYVFAVLSSATFTVGYVITVVMFVAQLLRRPMNLTARIVWLVLALAVWSALSFGVVSWSQTAFQSAFKAANGRPGVGVLALANALSVGIDASLLCAAALGGSLVAQLISSPNLLGPLCGLLAMLDVWFVLFQGIAAQMIKSAPAYAAKVTASAPAVGAAGNSHFVVSPVGIGAADYLFIGFFFAIMHRFGMNWRASTKWMIVLVAGALLAVMLGIGALPGLLFIGLASAIPNKSFFEYSKDEKTALLQAGGFVVLLTIGIYFAQPFIIAQMKQVK